MTEQEWAERRTEITDNLYEALLREADCGPFDGGCLVVALALQQVLGGDVVYLIAPSRASQIMPPFSSTGCFGILMVH